MRFEFKLPDIGEGVAEGEVVAWHVREGEQVGEDQLMVEVMTDKATVTISTPKAGKIAELRAQVGTTVKVGDVLVVIQTGNGASAHPPAPSTTAASAVGDIRETLPGASFFGRTNVSSSTTNAASSQLAAPEPARPRAVLPPPRPHHFTEKPLATPATRKLARDLGLDLRHVPPSGLRGQVTKQDVQAASLALGSYAQHGTEEASSAARSLGLRAPARPGAGGGPARADGQPAADAGDTRVPFVGMRRRIAERMQLAKNTAAHFTFVEECDASRLMALRDHLKPEARQRGVDLTFMPFIVKAVCCALKKHPLLNSSLDVASNELVMHGRCHIGIAAASDQGLSVPVVHHADSLDLYQLAHEVTRLGDAARTGRLTVQELTGSTFTITSLGKQSGLLAVPILNLPNVGILGVHRIKERPVVRAGQIVIGHIMLLSLSLDHRIVDGHVGAAFAYDVIGYLEEPALMFVNS
jgi:pyruvate dehydrogenase E2 component (dihydrolipoamide acetyltransferase)